MQFRKEGRSRLSHQVCAIFCFVIWKFITMGTLKTLKENLGISFCTNTLNFFQFFFFGGGWGRYFKLVSHFMSSSACKFLSKMI